MKTIYRSYFFAKLSRMWYLLKFQQTNNATVVFIFYCILKFSLFLYFCVLLFFVKIYTNRSLAIVTFIFRVCPPTKTLFLGWFRLKNVSISVPIYSVCLGYNTNVSSLAYSRIAGACFN